MSTSEGFAVEVSAHVSSGKPRWACVALTTLCCSAIGLLRPSTSRACGVSGPDGVWSCSLAEHEESLRPRFQLAVSGSYTATALRFERGLRAQQTRSGVVVQLAYAPVPRLSLQASAGAGLSGELRLPDGHHELLPGPLLALGASYELVRGTPFVVFSSALSFTAASARPPGPARAAVAYEASDLRLGAAFGTTLWQVLSPYATARVFGGPVFFRYLGRVQLGTDVSHYQLGVGLSARIAQALQLFVEGVPLGERALAAGAGAVF